jgi:hypothetical protein
MSHPDSGINFLVDYAETEGALAERVPEGALLLLPEQVRAGLGVPEELRLTEDPETAREDGYLLITAGHPLLMTAAGTVLSSGDVGCSTLAGPARPPPTPAALEGKAREQIFADHGRIDVTAMPRATTVAVVRVGALLTYSVSIDERVQELEEVWVFARSGSAIPDVLRERLRSAALEPGVPEGLGAPPPESVVGAHDLLGARARWRVGDLARQTSARMSGQLEVVDDYYGRVLSSIDERLRRAASDRAAMLTEQAEATRREWTRRRSEVTDDLTPTFEVKPFRLHLVGVPAYTVQAVLRRGTRTYQLHLDYLPVLSGFLHPSCPSCGSQAVLVVGKDRLGCRQCMAPSPSVVVPDRGEGGRPGTADRQEDAPKGTGPDGAPVVDLVPPPPGTAGRASPTALRPRSGPAKGTRPAKRSTGRVTPKGSISRTTGQTGMRVAMSFWSSVASGELRPRDAVDGSPMHALLRLYGSLGPALVIGVEDADQLEGISTAPSSFDPDGNCWTHGQLQRPGQEDAPFALFWRSGGRANLVEVQGLPLEQLAPLFARRDEFGKAMRQRFRRFLVRPPEPRVSLSPTAALLLNRSARLAGLGFAMRCLAAWEYVAAADVEWDQPASPLDPSRAAAIESVVGKRLDMRLTVPALAERYECPVDPVRRHLRKVQPVVRICTDLRW